MNATKQALINALRTFAQQRPGLEYGNYGDPQAYRAEVRKIGRHLADARILLRAVELRDSITAQTIVDALKYAYSGRLTLKTCADGAIEIGYCTGQYWPTEYRAAVCSLCANLLWSWMRDFAMPKPVLMHNSETGETVQRYQDLREGDWLRRQFAREFGIYLAARWFN